MLVRFERKPSYPGDYQKRVALGPLSAVWFDYRLGYFLRARQMHRVGYKAGNPSDRCYLLDECESQGEG
jgi:hypothetical protein